ncbi:helix-turn-helix domain-containing protein [Chloroflexota bacterium]
MDELRKTIADRLKFAREEKGLTQNDVAEILGVERASYAHVETGRNMLTIPNLFKLQEILDKPVTYFLDIGIGDLTADETELLELYRAIPPGDLKENVMNILRTTAQQARKPGRKEAWQIADEMSEEQAEELIETVRGLRAKGK